MDIKMTRNMRLAFRALKKIGAPVFANEDNIHGKNFQISAEQNVDRVWADYYWYDRARDLGDNQFPGFNKQICDVLERYGLYPEWHTAGNAHVHEIW